MAARKQLSLDQDMVTVCVSIVAKSICMVDETMKMDASALWLPMTSVSTCNTVLCRFIQVPLRLAYLV